MLVRLTVKLAEMVNGIDLSHCAEGDVIELADREARLLIAEGWAEEVSDDERVTCVPVRRPAARAVAADRPTRRQRRAQRTSSQESSEPGPDGHQ